MLMAIRVQSTQEINELNPTKWKKRKKKEGGKGWRALDVALKFKVLRLDFAKYCDTLLL